jgi:hypothetical protein
MTCLKKQKERKEREGGIEKGRERKEKVPFSLSSLHPVLFVLFLFMFEDLIEKQAI